MTMPKEVIRDRTGLVSHTLANSTRCVRIGGTRPNIRILASMDRRLNGLPGDCTSWSSPLKQGYAYTPNSFLRIYVYLGMGLYVLCHRVSGGICA